MTATMVLLGLLAVGSSPQGSSMGERPGASDEQTVVRRASVEVDTSEVGSEGPVIRRRILERADVTLRARGIVPAESPEDARITIGVRELPGEQPGYVADITLSSTGQTESIECALCTETELVARIEAHIDELAEGLEHFEVQPPSRTDAPVEPEPEVSPPSPSPPADVPHRLGAKGKTGIALLAVGLVAVGTGVGLAVAEPQPKEEMPLEATSTRTPGFVTLGTGAAVAVAGAVLLGLDRHTHRRIAIAPWPGRTAGATVSWRF